MNTSRTQRSEKSAPLFSAHSLDSGPILGSQSSGTHGLHGIVGKVLASSRGHRRLLRTSGSSCQNSTFGGHAHGPARREPLYGHRPLPHNILHLAPASIPSVLRAWFSFVRPYLPSQSAQCISITDG